MTPTYAAPSDSRVLGVLRSRQPAELDLSAHATPRATPASARDGRGRVRAQRRCSSRRAPRRRHTPRRARRPLASLTPLSAIATTYGGISGMSARDVARIDHERLEVAVVDADDRRAGVERALELGFVAHLDEHLELERRAPSSIISRRSSGDSARAMSSAADAPSARASSS